MENPFYTDTQFTTRNYIYSDIVQEVEIISQNFILQGVYLYSQVTDDI